MQIENTSFDSLAQLTAQVLGAPIAAVSVIRQGREHFLAGVGVPIGLGGDGGIPSRDGYCDHVVSARKPLIINDAYAHGAFREVRLTREFDWISYAGIPLISPRGHVVGALAVADHKPRQWTDSDLAALQAMAVPLVNEIEMRVTHSEQQRLNAQLRASAELFSSIVGASSDAIICVDEKQHIMVFNAGAEQIFGYGEAEMIGQPLDLLIPEGVRDLHRIEIDQFGQEDVTARFKNNRHGIFGRRKNGDVFPAEASITKIDVEGKRTYSAVLRDVSDREQYHAALVRRAEELMGVHAEVDRVIEIASVEIRQAVADCQAALARTELEPILHEELATGIARLHALVQQIIVCAAPSPVVP